MYLHKDDKELLRDIIVTVSERTGIDESIVEKDYYVTMILKELVQRNPMWCLRVEHPFPRLIM